MKVTPGDAVLTKFGVGVVVRCFNDNNGSSSSRPTPTRHSQQQQQDKGGDNDDRDSDGTPTSTTSTTSTTWAVVRLWRQPGKSIASGATATLRVEGDCILKKLVAAPGMIVRASQHGLDAAPAGITSAAADDGENDDVTSTTASTSQEEKKVIPQNMYLIERYLLSKDIFLASSIDGDDDTGEINGGDNKNNHSLARSLAVMSSPSNNRDSSPMENDQDECDNFTTPQSPKDITCECSLSTKKYHQLQPSQISPSSTSAKFYPILEDLMSKGEAAWSVAVEKSSDKCPELAENLSTVTTALSSAVKITTPDGEHVAINNAGGGSNVAKILSDTSKSSMETLHEKLGDATTPENGTIPIPQAVANVTAKEALATAADKAKNVSAAATEGLSVPQAEEISQIYKMLRDEDLTKLFEIGKERLRELVEVEIPVRTKKALGAMGIELEDEDEQQLADALVNGKKTMRGGMDRLRKEALASLDQILTMNTEDGKIVVQASNGNGAIQIDTKTIIDPSLLPATNVSATEVKQMAQVQFAAMFDRLSRAATSDPQLSTIFSSISEKTKSWQEMTGRLLQTKTAGLFAEGSQRLKSRAADILNVAPGQLRDAFGNAGRSGEGGSDLTRAFTEGDVAMAKLKSMEMGDAVRKRLFDAIELRSESNGGLDAIIAGSLAAIQRKGDAYGNKAEALLGKRGLEDVTLSSAVGRAKAAAVSASSGSKEGISEDTIHSVISNLQQSATSSMKGTKETLIALLSRRSGYRDAVLLRLEQVFLDLESQLGQDMSAEQIADLASGEGGSLALFQPVAMKAAKEIEAQLDAVEAKMRESKHWNPKADDALGKVRKITRGELSMTDILDMAAGYLDDEEVVAKSGGLIVKAESLLDNFEAASARLGDAAGASKSGVDAAPGIMDAVAKAGITKDTVMKGVEGLDVDKLLDDTRNAVTDETARRELISGAGDAALDFLLKILPSMPVPPFDGVRDGLVYHLSNLSMAGFKVKKEDIHIEIAGIKAAAAKKSGSGSDASISQSQPRRVQASELLIIDVKNISATLDDAAWSFEQTYMPYLKGSGKANTRLWDGAIRLKFELRRRIATVGEKDPVTELPLNPTWEPVLCLNDRACTIGGIELTIQGESRIAWVANRLVSVLKNPLRDYVVSVIINALKTHSGWLIDVLNKNLSNYWDFILRTAKLQLDDLPKLARHHVTEAEIPVDTEETVELVWRERVPLGLNILTNDESGYLKVIDFPRGTQARKVAQSKQLDPDMFRGSTIVSVNGRRYGPDNQVELFAALKDPARPKAILLKIASQDDLERMEGIVKKGKSSGAAKGVKKAAPTKNENKDDINDLVTVVDILEKGDIGLKFSSSGHDNIALAVSDFLRDANGGQLPAEKTGKISVNDLLSHVNRTLVLGSKGTGKQRALQLLEEAGPTRRPLKLGFVKPYLFSIVLEKPHEHEEEYFGGPSELVFAEVKKAAGESTNENRIVLKDFAVVEGAAETGGVFVGDNLAFINGIPVGAGCRLLDGSGPSPKLDEVIRMLKQYTPLALTFARAQAKQKTSTVKTYLTSSPLSLDIESSYTFSIAATDYSHLGCQFVTGMNGSDIVVKGMSGVEGLFQRQIKASNQPFVGCRLVSVDAEIVPSYVNSQLIVNAMKRRWATNGRVELTFCNERHRDALRKLESLDGASS